MSRIQLLLGLFQLGLLFLNLVPCQGMGHGRARQLEPDDFTDVRNAATGDTPFAGRPSSSLPPSWRVLLRVGHGPLPSLRRGWRCVRDEAVSGL